MPTWPAIFKGAKPLSGREYANASENFVRVIESGRLRWNDADQITADLRLDRSQAARVGRVAGRQGPGGSPHNRRARRHPGGMAGVRPEAGPAEGDVMGLWTSLRRFLALEPMQAWTAEPMQQRSTDLETQITAIQANYAKPRPWRPASITEALGVPAIFGAVNMIANLVGSMSMKALQNEVELPPADRPRLIIRPDPFQIPREFYRGTAYNLASRGEAWWWVAARDSDGSALSILNVPPAEVTVEENPRDLRLPHRPLA